MTLTNSSRSDERVNHMSLLLTAWAATWPHNPPSQILSQLWAVVSQLWGESHWMKLFDIWLYSPRCLHVVTDILPRRHIYQTHHISFLLMTSQNRFFSEKSYSLKILQINNYLLSDTGEYKSPYEWFDTWKP